MRISRKLAVASVATALGALALAPVAAANPTPEFEQFSQCAYENLEVTECFYSVLSGGAIEIGEKTIPIKNPITFQGGVKGSGIFVAAENGETLSKTPQPVPGGLAGVTAPTSWPQGLQDAFNKLIEEGFTGVNATIMLAKPASAITVSVENLASEEEVTGLGLPAKIKLDNPAFGGSCFIGSSEEPLQLELRTGPSGSLTGTAGAVTFNGAFTLTTFSGIKLVDGTFTAPEAEGCGGAFSAFIDPFVDSFFGLPAGEGENAATLEGKFQAASAAAVRGP